jgi:hypothetical protein
VSRSVRIARAIIGVEAEIRVAEQRLTHDIGAMVEVAYQQFFVVVVEPFLARIVIVAVCVLPQELRAVQMVEYTKTAAISPSLRGREAY